MWFQSKILTIIRGRGVDPSSSLNWYFFETEVDFILGTELRKLNNFNNYLGEFLERKLRRKQFG